MSEVVFLVSSRSQVEVAAAVAEHLQLVRYGNWATLEESEAPPEDTALPRTTARGLRAARRWGRDLARRGAVVVVQQDVTTEVRVLIAAARPGARVVLLPDGVTSSDPQATTTRNARLLTVVDRLTEASRLTVGTRGHFGSSRPDLLLSWGPGWDDAWRRAAPGSRIVDTGSPRFDPLVQLPDPPADDRVLVLSQPLWQSHVGGQDTYAAWLEAVDRLCTSAPEHAVVVRPHPAERPTRDWPETLLARMTRRGFADDLTDAGTVLSVFSTGLLEAAVARRAVARVVVNEHTERVTTSVPVFASGLVPTMRAADLGWPCRVDGATTARGVSAFAAQAGAAATAVAAAILAPG